MKNLILILITISTLFACANQSADKNYSKEASFKKTLATPTEASTKDANTDAIELSESIDLQRRQLIKTADYRIQVENVDKSTTNIQRYTQQFGGIISNMNLTSDSYQIQNNITILVPNQNFEALLEGITQDATYINHKSINTTDVTEEFVDLEARLATKKRVRDRYTDLLRSKAGTLDEVFAAEEKIRVLQEEIEAKEGRLHYLQEKVSNSSCLLYTSPSPRDS